MTTRRKSFLIEIPEDAYKQNSVYRPWDDITIDGSPVYRREANSQPTTRSITITQSHSSAQSQRKQGPSLAP